MDEMNITSVQHVVDYTGNNACMKAVINGKEYIVPNDAPGNIEYDEIMKQVEAGDLTIADAD